MIVVFPIASGVRVVPEIEAIEGSDEVKLQSPVELDVGGIKFKLEMLARFSVTSP